MNNLLDLPLRYSLPPFKRMMVCIVQCLRSLRACPVLSELSMFKKCQVGICTRLLPRHNAIYLNTPVTL
jgi:hypothetical protein